MTATDQQEAIRAEGLTKRFGATTAVDGLDLTVTNGEIFALLGVNGAGKTPRSPCSPNSAWTRWRTNAPTRFRAACSAA